MADMDMSTLFTLPLMLAKIGFHYLKVLGHDLSTSLPFALFVFYLHSKTYFRKRGSFLSKLAIKGYYYHNITHKIVFNISETQQF